MTYDYVCLQLVNCNRDTLKNNIPALIDCFSRDPFNKLSDCGIIGLFFNSTLPTSKECITHIKQHPYIFITDDQLVKQLKVSPESFTIDFISDTTTHTTIAGTELNY
jgi:hypothetical protein